MKSNQPRRWVVERGFAWTARVRRLARDYEYLDSSLTGFQYIILAILFASGLLNTALLIPPNTF